jgi:hypothetical protein
MRASPARIHTLRETCNGNKEVQRPQIEFEEILIEKGNIPFQRPEVGFQEVEQQFAKEVDGP